MQLSGGNYADILLGGSAGDTLVGGGGNDKLKGGGGEDGLNGGQGNDIIDGGTGIDTMSGGANDDTYVVDEANDGVTEAAGEGRDRVLSSAQNYTLTNDVELLVLTGTADISGTGNGLDNQIQGNAGSNVIDGGVGADRMTGGDGGDSYYVDNAGDVVIEEAGRGDDSVYSTVSHTLRANVENLYMLETAANGTGNASNNFIAGTNAANVLSGGDGNDRISCGGGDDRVMGGNGSDMLFGGGGADLLFGNAGADVFYYEATGESTQASRDQIRDFTVGNDKIDLRPLSAFSPTLTFVPNGGAFKADGTPQVHVVRSGGNALVEVDSDGNRTADMQIVLTGVNAASVTADDFLL